MKIQTTHKGIILFPDLPDMQTFDRDYILSEYQRFQVDVKIFLHPKNQKLFFTCDLPTWEEGWGGVFKCFLFFEDNKMLGHFEYVREANLPNEKVEASFEMTDSNFIAKGEILVTGQPQYGLYIELDKV